MTQNRSFIRKLVYCCAIAVLLAPVAWLSAPATSGSATRAASEGGKLARLRTEYKLSQASLGEIDPASETIKLATLGMRGVASTLLWQKAYRDKMTEDWTSLAATLEQITNLQPNFIVVWQYQSWNLSYNVSVQFDNLQDRYYWVIRGLNFLEEGIQYNENDPNLMWDMGWFLGHKIGNSDERVYFREFFRNDDEYHASHDHTDKMRDNWQLGKYWFLQAQQAHDTTGKPIKGRTELIFHMYPALWQSNYAKWVEIDGVFGEIARREWATAAEDWRNYGERPIPIESGFEIQMGKLEEFQAEAAAKRAQLEALAGPLAVSMRDELRAKLPEDQRRILALAPEFLTDEQKQLAEQAEQLLKLPVGELARKIRESGSRENGSLALSLAEDIGYAEMQANLIELNRPHMNFEYWVTRAELEQTDEALLARELVHQADEQLEAGDPKQARRLYEGAFAQWRLVLDRYPTLVSDAFTGDEFMQVIARYDRSLKEDSDAPFPSNFPLRDIIDWHDQDGRYRGRLGAVSETASPGSSPSVDFVPAEISTPGEPPEPPPISLPMDPID